MSKAPLTDGSDVYARALRNETCPFLSEPPRLLAGRRNDPDFRKYFWRRGSVRSGANMRADSRMKTDRRLFPSIYYCELACAVYSNTS